MGTNYIYNVKTPINNDQGVDKSYADTKLSLSGGLMTGNLDMNNNMIYNLAQPNGNDQPATKAFPVFNVLKTCGEYFLTIDLGIVEFIKKFI